MNTHIEKLMLSQVHQKCVFTVWVCGCVLMPHDGSH